MVKAFPLRLLVSLLPAAVLLVPATDACAGMHTVCPSGCAYDGIQAAVDAAADGDTILVGAGTYRERLLLEGRQLTIRSEAGREATVIDGAPAGPSDPPGSVVTIRNADIRVEGFTLTGGGGTTLELSPFPGSATLPPEPHTVGGGVLVVGSHLVLAASALLGNSADRGAALGGWHATVEVADSLIFANTPGPRRSNGSRYRATVWLHDPDLWPGTPQDSAFQSERTEIRDNDSGGIFVSGGWVRLFDSLVGGNANCNENGAVNCRRSEVHRSVIRDNDGGPGLFVSGLSYDENVDGCGAVVADSAILRNGTMTRSQRAGGIAALYCGQVSIRNSLISGNYAAGSGGGVSLQLTRRGEIVNSVISGNRSGGAGGGIWIHRMIENDHTTSIVNCTISGNRALEGGGIADHSTAGETLVLNAVVWGNEAIKGHSEILPPEEGTLHPRLGVLFSNVRGGAPGAPGAPWPGEGNIDACPRFLEASPAALAPTAAGDFRLTPCSPCIDAGGDARERFPLLPPDDLEGLARPHFGGYDMGAYEAQGAPAAGAPPDAADDRAATAEDAPVSIPVLANDTFPDRPVEAVRVVAAVHGTAVADGDGTVTFTPEPNFNGSAVVYYLVDDGRCTDVATAAVAVNPLGDPPFEVCADRCAHPTIQGAIDAAGDGDTVLVHDGTYRETIAFRGKALRVTSVNGPRVTVIDGGGDEDPYAGSVVRFVAAEGPGSVLEGFTVRNGSASGGGGILVDGRGLRDELDLRPAAPTITNCIVEGNRSSVLLQGKSGGAGGGIAVFEASPTIRRCIIRGNRALVGGGLYNASFLGGHAEILDTVITGNHATGVELVGYGVYESLGSGAFLGHGSIRFAHCTVAGNGADGLGAAFDADVALLNSIVWGNGGADLAGPAGVFRVRHSDLSVAWAGGGNISADPRFVSPVDPADAPTAAGDYHITRHSPCRELGLPALSAEDVDGERRPWGGGSDMGADEYIPASLLRNGSFEGGKLDAPPWEGAVLTAGDGRTCERARFGDCSFTLGGSTGAKKVLKQVVASDAPGRAGDLFTLTGWSRSRGARRGGYALEVRFTYADGTTGVRRLPFSAGTHGWERVSRSFTAGGDYRQVAVSARFARQRGRAWFDGITLLRR